MLNFLIFFLLAFFFFVFFSTHLNPLDTVKWNEWNINWSVFLLRLLMSGREKKVEWYSTDCFFCYASIETKNIHIFDRKTFDTQYLVRAINQIVFWHEFRLCRLFPMQNKTKRIVTFHLLTRKFNTIYITVTQLMNTF